MKPIVQVLWAAIAGLTVVTAGVVVLGVFDKDTQALLMLVNLLVSTGNSIATAIVNGKVERVVQQTNGTNDRLLGMVAQTHPGIPTPPPIDPPERVSTD